MQVTVPFSPEQASTYAGDVDNLYGFLWAMTIAFGVVITLAIIYFAVKYRRRTEEEIPRPIEGSMKLEVAWTVIPFFIAMGIFVWGTSIYFKQYTIPNEALEIYVQAKQWMWKFQHATGQREINELHVPLGRRVKLTMTTEDVIHSFYVPAFRIKLDVVPGKYSTIWFEPTRAGRYHLFCAEYCGTSHSGMIGWINVMEPSEYQAWLAGGATEGSLASAGQKLFQDLMCNNCHRPGGRGPELEGLFGKQQRLTDGTTVTVDESYIRESIRMPAAKVAEGFQPVMPTFTENVVSEEQLVQLIEYIKSLGQQKGAAGTAPGTGTPSPQPPSAASTGAEQQGLPEANRPPSNNTRMSNPVGSAPPANRRPQ
ncbi:MAG TPA: cytochrome c oxidase subunit II [Blastocatellia bacterium]|nr:cytochrome c oxidase subunit II [Blastocatellia bacterium]